MGDRVIEFQNVSFHYAGRPRAALEDVTFSIRKGAFFGIVGPNGGGKSTLLKLLLGALQAESGRVLVLGRDAATLGRDRRLLGYLPQDTVVHPYFPATVLDVALMGTYSAAGLFGRITKEHIGTTRAALHKVGLDDHERTSARALSGGQQQRLLIARALAAQPQVLVLDEPTNSLDADGQAQLFALLKTLLADGQLTVVMVSHDVHSLLHHADEIACIDQTVRWNGGRDSFDETLLQDFAEGRGAGAR